MTIRISTAAVIMAGLLLGACQHSGLWGDDEGLRYVQRLDKITDSAGDAKEWNRVVQTDHPYPRYAYDHRIPVDGSITHRAVCSLMRQRGGKRTTTDTNISVGNTGAVATSHSVTEPMSPDCEP